MTTTRNMEISPGVTRPIIKLRLNLKGLEDHARPRNLEGSSFSGTVVPPIVSTGEQNKENSAPDRPQNNNDDKTILSKQSTLPTVKPTQHLLDIPVDVEAIEKPATKEERPSKKRPLTKTDGKVETASFKLASTNPAYGTIAAVRPQAPPTMGLTRKVPMNPSPASRTGFSRVPIAALSAYSTMTPAEREEERFWRQSLNEIFGGFWKDLNSPNLTRNTPRNFNQLSEQVLPYWLMLAPVDVAVFGNRSGTGSKPTSSNPNPLSQADLREAKERRWNEEYNKLVAKFDGLYQGIRQKEVPTELLLLEQKLCLEEEKFLFAKLKNDYNSKVIEIMSRKRKAALASSSAALNNIPSLPSSADLPPLKNDFNK